MSAPKIPPAASLSSRFGEKVTPFLAWFRLAQYSGNAVNCGGDFFRATRHGAHHAARTGAVAEKILADIRGAFTGQQLGDIEIRALARSLNICSSSIRRKLLNLF